MAPFLWVFGLVFAWVWHHGCGAVGGWGAVPRGFFVWFAWNFPGCWGVGGWLLLGFGFRCCGSSDGSSWPLFESGRLLFSRGKRSVSPVFL